MQLNYIVDINNDSVVAYQWDFSNNNQYIDATGKQCSKIFNGHGLFSVGLRIISINNDTAYARKDVIVDALPIADFTVQEVCQNEFINVSNTSLLNGSIIKKYQWFFDGVISAADTLSEPPPFSFKTEGLHEISLEAITDKACTASVHKNVTVNPIPVSDFLINNSCIGDTSSFKATSTINSGSISQYQWDFNSDGQFQDGTGANAQNAFFATGNWPVSLRTISSKGCKHDTLKSIAIYPRPHAQFILNDGCTKTNIDVDNISFTDFGSLNSFWTFDHNDTSTSWSSPT